MWIWPRVRWSNLLNWAFKEYDINFLILNYLNQGWAIEKNLGATKIGPGSFYIYFNLYYNTLYIFFLYGITARNWPSNPLVPTRVQRYWYRYFDIDISKKIFFDTISIRYIDISIFFSIFKITFLKCIKDKFLWYIILVSYNYIETLLPCFTKQGLRSVISSNYQIK